MRSKSRSFVILLCLFLISFKVAASSVYIGAAIERVQTHQSVHASSVNVTAHSSKGSFHEQHTTHNLFLMSHVLANVSDTEITLPYCDINNVDLNGSYDILLTQNFPDSVYKPPKITC